MPLGKIHWGKAKRDPGDAARAAAAATTLTQQADGTATYRGWTITPSIDDSGQYVAQKAGSLDVIAGPSLPVLKIQIDAAEASGTNPNAPVAVYQGWSILRAGGAGSNYNPFAAASSASGPLYTATKPGTAWPAQMPHTLQEVYAIIDRLSQGVTRPQDPIVQTYQGWNVRQVETDGRFYANNPSTGQSIGGMPTLQAVTARIDQYTQPMQPAYPGGQVPYYQPQYAGQPQYQQPIQRDMWGNPVQNSYVPQTSADPSMPVPISSAQPLQLSQAGQVPYYAPQPMQASYPQPMPSQGGAEEYGYSEAANDDATYTGTNGLGMIATMVCEGGVQRRKRGVHGLGAVWGGLHMPIIAPLPNESKGGNTPNPGRKAPWWEKIQLLANPPEVYNGWTIYNLGAGWTASKSNGQRIAGIATKDELRAAIDRQNLADAGVKPANPTSTSDEASWSDHSATLPLRDPAGMAGGLAYYGSRKGWVVGGTPDLGPRGYFYATKGGRTIESARGMTSSSLQSLLAQIDALAYGAAPFHPQYTGTYRGWSITRFNAGEYRAYRGQEVGSADYGEADGASLAEIKRKIDAFEAASPTPLPSPTPSPVPTPSPTPLPSPTPSPVPTPSPSPSAPSVHAPTVGGPGVQYGDWIIRAGDPTGTGYYNQQPFFAGNMKLGIMAIGQTFPNLIAKIDKANINKPTQLDGFSAQEAMGGLLVLGAVAGVLMVAHQLSRRRK